MFGWFGSICPCDSAAKSWVEDRLQWLSKQFGLHILLERPIILPTAEFFPDPWDGTPEASGRLWRAVPRSQGPNLALVGPEPGGRYRYRRHHPRRQSP